MASLGIRKLGFWGMRFRWFRSKAFWLGVPGLVFLLWGWWVSMGYHSWVEVGSIRDWELGQFWGRVYAFWYVDGWPNWQELYAEHAEVPADGLSEFELEMAEARQEVASFRYFMIPYALVLLIYLALWAGLLIWRKRKFEKRPVA